MKWFHFYENGQIRLGVQTLSGPVDMAATAARRHLTAPADLHELLAGGDDALAQVNRLLAGKTGTGLRNRYDTRRRYPGRGKSCAWA